MHEMLVHFSDLKPTWFLLPWSWAANQYSATYHDRLTDAVPIGRVKWFENSKHTSANDFGWFRFDRPNDELPVLHPRQRKGS